MKYIENFGDKRQSSSCIYCGGGIETQEHAPSRVFLDKPYPDNLPVVQSCAECNNNFSLDEEYVACLIECATVGSVNFNLIKRDKIRRILIRKPALVKKLREAMVKTKGSVSFFLEKDRIERVLLKLAQCHHLYERNESILVNPTCFRCGLLDNMPENSREIFEEVPILRLSPEVGSRAMQNIQIFKDIPRSQWISVQKDRYRYLVAGNIVRLVISEYVWCEVEWS